MNENTTTKLHRLLLETTRRFLLHMDDLEITITPTVFGRRIRKAVLLRPHRSDKSRLIGSQGRTFKALAQVCRSFGLRQDELVMLEHVLEPVIGLADRYAFEPNSNWPAGAQDFADWLKELAEAVYGGDATVTCHDSTEDTTTQVSLFVLSQPGITMVESDGLAAALMTLVDMVGQSYGRKMSLSLKDEPRGEQPATADGRWAKARPQ